MHKDALTRLKPSLLEQPLSRGKARYLQTCTDREFQGARGRREIACLYGHLFRQGAVAIQSGATVRNETDRAHNLREAAMANDASAGVSVNDLAHFGEPLRRDHRVPMSSGAPGPIFVLLRTARSRPPSRVFRSGRGCVLPNGPSRTGTPECRLLFQSRKSPFDRDRLSSK